MSLHLSWKDTHTQILIHSYLHTHSLSLSHIHINTHTHIYTHTRINKQGHPNVGFISYIVMTCFGTGAQLVTNKVYVAKVYFTFKFRVFLET